MTVTQTRATLGNHATFLVCVIMMPGAHNDLANLYIKQTKQAYQD